MREVPFSRIDTNKVRAHANERVNQTSLRQLALEIGLGHSTLHSFLSVATPHPRVRDLLFPWYVQQTGDEGEPVLGEVREREGASLRVRWIS